MKNILIDVESVYLKEILVPVKKRVKRTQNFFQGYDQLLASLSRIDLPKEEIPRLTHALSMIVEATFNQPTELISPLEWGPWKSKLPLRGKP